MLKVEGKCNRYLLILIDLSDLRELRKLGVGSGVVRPAFSDYDMEARYWLKRDLRMLILIQQ